MPSTRHHKDATNFSFCRNLSNVLLDALPLHCTELPSLFRHTIGASIDIDKRNCTEIFVELALQVQEKWASYRAVGVCLVGEVHRRYHSIQKPYSTNQRYVLLTLRKLYGRKVPCKICSNFPPADEHGKYVENKT